MKILFVGRELVAQHFAQALEQETVTVAASADWPNILRLIAIEEFDMAILDSELPSVSDICSRLSALEIMPTILLVNQFGENWTSLQSVCTDAFITESATNPEILARINAIFRRSKKGGLVAQH